MATESISMSMLDSDGGTVNDRRPLLHGGSGYRTNTTDLPPATLRVQSKAVFLLLIVFGLGSWITVNGIFGELPLLVDHVPEGWAVSSYLAVATQAANVGPVLFFFAARANTGSTDQAIVPTIYALTLVGFTSCILLGFLWRRTSTIDGQDHSTALVILTFFSALADCTSTVTFYPFVGRFSSVYVPALLIGEGLSGFIAAALTWIQTDWFSEHTELFSPTVYFYLLAAMMAASGIAFWALNNLSVSLAEQLQCSLKQSYEHVGGVDKSYLVSTNAPRPKQRRFLGVVLPSKAWLHREMGDMCVLLWLNVLSNGVVASVLSYATLPYSRSVYELSMSLSLCVNPLAAFVVTKYRVKSQKFLVAAWTACSAYVLAFALMSPDPPLKDHSAGAALMVVVSVIGAALLAYSKTCLLLKLRESAEHSGEPVDASMFVAGTFVQFGSLVGTVTMFVLVNHTHLFKQG